MKNIIRKSAVCFASLLLGAGVFSSCVEDIRFGDNFLEKAPGVDVQIDDIFSKAENARYFLWQLYNHLHNPLRHPNFAPPETITDLMHTYQTWGGIQQAWYRGTVSSSSGLSERFPIQNGGEGRANLAPWTTFRHAWIFIENVDNVPDMSDTEKSQLKAEALLIMASRYFDCFRHYGGLPLIDHAFASDEDFYAVVGRATVEDTVNFIDSLLQRAIDEPGFPWRIADQEAYAGRLTKSGAVALRAKLWVFAASPLFNDNEIYREFDNPDANKLLVWYGSKSQALWQKALDACEDFFEQNQSNGGFYQLIQPTSQDERGYRLAFRSAYWNRGNSEKIIEVHGAYTAGSAWSSAADGQSMASHGMLNPTVQLFNMFPMSDGKNYPYASIYNTDNPGNIDIFEDRDPRLYETLALTRESLMDPYCGLTNLQMWQGAHITNHSGVRAQPQRLFSGLPLFKWVMDQTSTSVSQIPISYSYLRVADMHLLYAEALAETGDLTGALREINKVRARVGLANIQIANPELNLTTNKDNLIQEILRERACELAMEDDRLYDLVRRKQYSRFTNEVHEMVLWRKTAGGQKDERENTTLVEGESWPHFIYETRVVGTNSRNAFWDDWDNKYLLCPWPLSEVNKNYGLEQNPGW